VSILWLDLRADSSAADLLPLKRRRRKKIRMVMRTRSQKQTRMDYLVGKAGQPSEGKTAERQ
jgi:hypothetical protein